MKKDFYMKKHFENYPVTRRTLLKGAAATGLIAAAAPLSSLASFARVEAADVKSFAVLQKLTGEVFINGKAAAEKDPISAGDSVRTGKNSTAWVLIQGTAITMIKHLSNVIISGALDKNGAPAGQGAALTIHTGAALNYIHANKKSPYPYSIKTPSVIAGVRGTTFFVEIFDETRTYVCDCFGNLELTSSAAPAVVKKLTTEHHTALLIGQEGSDEDALMKPAGLLHHTDEEIADMKQIFAATTGLKPLKEKQQPPSDDEGFQY